jgi:hypothetical protein
MSAVDDFGVELRRRRTRAGLSLSALAALVHYTVPHLSRVETGDRHASVELARLCDAALGAGGVLAALVPDRSPAVVAEPAAPGDDEPGLPAVLFHAGGPVIGDPAARQSLRTLFRCLRESGQRTATAGMLSLMTDQTRTVCSLAAAAGETARRELFQLAAHHAEYVGWLCQEQGDTRGAMTWTARAVLLDQYGGGSDMAAYALVRRAELALYRGRPAQAAGLAVQAQRADVVNPRIHALAAQREAQAHALAGDRARCEAALDRSAQRWARRSARQHRRDLFGSSSVPDLTAMVAAWCEVDLGRPDEASHQITAVLATLPANARRARALLTARLAVARAADGAVDASCEIAAAVAADARILNSATTLYQLRRLSTVLRRWPRHRTAAATRADLNDLLRRRG